MKLTKSIAYAYATSDTAAKLGFRDNGCYFIEKKYEDGLPFADEQAGGFMDKCQDLKDSFFEADGEVCQISLKYSPQNYQ